jgi:hypothetical protein
MPLVSDEEVVCPPGTCEVCDELRTWIAAGLAAGADPGQIMLVFVTMLQEQADGSLVIQRVDEGDAEIFDAMVEKGKGELH